MVRSDSHAAAVAHGRMLASFVAPCAGACGPGMRPLAGALAGAKSLAGALAGAQTLAGALARAQSLAGALAGAQSLAGALAGGAGTSWSLAGVEMGLQPTLQLLD